MGGREGRAGRAAADLSSSGLGLCSRAVASQPGRPEGRENQKNPRENFGFPKKSTRFFWVFRLWAEGSPETYAFS